MRTLAFVGLAAFMAIAPATAESAPTGDGGRTVMTRRDWGSVPTIPLRPPGAAMSPASVGSMGDWSGSGGWRGGQGNWRQGRPERVHTMPPGGPARMGQWRGQPGSWSSWPGGHGKGMGHFRPRRGFFMPRFFVSPTFFVSNWWTYGLAEPGNGRNWVRYYGDAVLIDDRGYIYDTAPGVDWDDEGPGPDDDFYDRYDDDAVSWGWGAHYGRSYAPAVYYVPIGGTTTVIVQSPPVVTTTTTYVDEEVVRARPKAWKPRRAWKPRPKCVCK